MEHRVSFYFFKLKCWSKVLQDLCMCAEIDLRSSHKVVIKSAWKLIKIEVVWHFFVKTVLLLLIKHYNLYKVLACSMDFFQLSLFCAIFFQLCTFIFLISSKTPFSQRVLGLPIGLLDIGFHLLILCTLLSSAMRSTWPNQFNLCFLINPIIFRP